MNLVRTLLGKSRSYLLMGVFLMLSASGCDNNENAVQSSETTTAEKEGELFALNASSTLAGGSASLSVTKVIGTAKKIGPSIHQIDPAKPMSVCCQEKVGNTSIMTNIACKEINGSFVSFDKCQEVSLCCQVDKGLFIFMTNTDCQDLGGMSSSIKNCKSDEGKVCCVPEKGVPMLTNFEDCDEDFEGTIVNNSICEEESISICCSEPSGAFSLTTNYACAVLGGSQTALAYCDNPDICCQPTYGPAFVGPQSDCDGVGGSVVPMTYCEEPAEDICCQMENSILTTTTDGCLKGGGVIINSALCKDACCEVDGVAIVVPMGQCELLAGVFLSDEECEDSPVCCELPNGPATLLESDCLAQGGAILPDTFCDTDCTVEIENEVSLVVTDQVILDQFPMAEVMDQLADFGPGASGGQTGTDLFQQWWSSQRERTGSDPASHPFCDDNGSTINGFPIACPRGESVLEDFDASTHKPIGLFNRFDAAPTNGAHCGEYRIVYALDNTAGLGGRNFIIFEGVLENPDPDCGLIGCRPVAEFWANIGDEPDLTLRGQLLHDFFFNGLPGFAPIVRPESYGLVAAGVPSGQIRTNQFMGGNWNLREFILQESAGEMIAQQTTVKGNPSPSLWTGTDPNSAAYQADYVAQMALQMPAVEDINKLGMETFDIYNTGESISLGVSPNLASYNPGTALTAAIAAAIPGSSFLDPADVAERAQAVTCGGCHQASSNANLGTQFSLGIDLMWPIQNPSFVHIDENSTLSTALMMAGGFLDARAQVLEDFLDLTCDIDCLTEPIVVLVDGSFLTAGDLQKALDDEKAAFDAEVAAECKAPADTGTGEEAAADGEEKAAVPNEPTAEELCTAEKQKGFVSDVANSVKPTPTDPNQTTLSGKTTH